MQGSFSCLQTVFPSFCLLPPCATVANVTMWRVSDLALPAKETLCFGKASPKNMDPFPKIGSFF